MKQIFFFLLTSLVFAAPKKQTTPVINDEDFVPLKRQASPKPPVNADITTESRIEPHRTEEAKALPESTDEITEVLLSKSYLKMDAFQSIPDNYIVWDDRNAQNVYNTKTGNPFILLVGRIRDAHSLMVNEKKVPLTGGNFEYKVLLPLEPAPLKIGVIKPDGQNVPFTLNYVWLKSLSSIRGKVRDSETGNIIDKSTGFTGEIKLAANAELTARGTPLKAVDNIQHKKQALTFNIRTPESDQRIEYWSLTIRNEKKQLYAKVKRIGTPPSTFPWNDFVPDILPVGNYFYSVSLYTKNGVYDGPEVKFEAIKSGTSVAQSMFEKTFIMEPKEEIGYLSFKNNNSFNTSSLYVATELPLIIKGKFILRPGGTLAIPTIDPENAYYSARALVGLRLNSEGKNFLLFGPNYYLKFDILLGLTRFSLSSRSVNPDFNHLTLVLQPDLVLWKQQYLQPVFEYSSSTTFKSMRVSLGLVYQFYIASWNLKWGMGGAMDSLFQDEVSANKYSLFRFFSSFQFQL